MTGDTGRSNDPRLDAFFTPNSIAVIGASSNPLRLGYFLVENLLRERFAGQIFPVNREGGVILGLPVATSVAAIPHSVELALIAVPAAEVADYLVECGHKGVQAAVIISAGFKETGAAGQQREDELLAVARRFGIRLVGPNSLGVIDTFHALNASFAEAMPDRWEVAVLSQSGAMATAILDWSRSVGVGFSKFVSLGNMADVSEVELLEYWADDSDVQVIVAYLEGITDGRRFLAAARRLTHRKPVIAMKVGRTRLGAAAAVSHTGSLANDDQVVAAAFRQAGVVRAETMEELFDFTRCFAYAPLPLTGDRVAVVTNAGGPGVMAADAIERAGLQLATLNDETLQSLAVALPSAGSIHNPVDILGDAYADRYEAALDAVLADPAVDAVMVLLTPQAMTEPERTARAIISRAHATVKPVFGVFMGGVAVERGRAMLEEARVPVYPYPERAIRAFSVLAQYARFLDEAGRG